MAISGFLLFVVVVQLISSSSSSETGSCSTNVAEKNSCGAASNEKAPEFGGVSFTLHFNGNGTDEGILINSKDFKEVDDVIEKYCWTISHAASETIEEEQCERGTGSRLVTETGIRVVEFSNITKPNSRVYLVPAGLHFVWPLVKVGNVIIPQNVKSPKGEEIRLVQLSNSPRVFQVQNFVSDDEIAEIIRKNEKKLTPSEVGFKGWQDSTRTSWTSWDTFSKSSKAIVERTFQILGMDVDHELSDTLQVLRYEPGQWYKPHTDYFDDKGYDNPDPTMNNGTNRFATMFLYLNTVDEGGHTVFPLSTTHEGYNGEQLVHPGTVNTPGYIDTKEAYQCCNVTSAALKSAPIKGNAVLFYSQRPDGKLDPYSLHGGCPPLKGVKWSGNVWIWNRERPDKSKAKDSAPDGATTNSDGFLVRFVNTLSEDVQLLWDPSFGDEDADPSSYVDQGIIKPEVAHPIQTYITHTFFAKLGDNIIWKYQAKREDTDSRVYITNNGEGQATSTT